MKKIECTYQIEKEWVSIYCEHTTFVQARNIEAVSLDEVLENLKTLKRVAKEKGNVKLVGVNLFRKYLIENYPTYLQDVMEFRATFSVLLNQCEVIKKEGIYVPAVDNVDVKVANTIRHQLDKMLYRSTDLSHYLTALSIISRYTSEIIHQSEDIISSSFYLHI